MNKRIRTGLVSTALVAGTFIGAGAVSAQTDDTDTTTDTTTEQSADETPADEAPTDGQRGPRGERRAERAQATADLLGIDVEELQAARQEGQTLAQLAEANGVDVQTVIDAKVAAATEKINAAVESGRLTANEAAEKIAGLEDKITTAVNEGSSIRANRAERRTERAQATADLLGIDVTELQSAVQGGLTLAEIAEANGVDVQTVVDAKVAAATEKINAAVESGRLTADEAAEKLADVEERVTTRVNEGRPDRGDRPGRGGAPVADATETDG